jgi:hypothetical protein
MKPRRTLLVVITKKVEWGILSVADIAVKRVISGYIGRAARGGRSWPPATRWPRRWIICRSRWTRLPSIWPPPVRRRRLRRLSAPVGLTRSFWISSLPLPVRLPRADGVLTGRRVFVDFAVPHDNAKISVGFFEGMFSKASPSARAPSSAIKVDLLNTTRPPVQARTPAALNTGALP